MSLHCTKQDPRLTMDILDVIEGELCTSFSEDALRVSAFNINTIHEQTIQLTTIYNKHGQIWLSSSPSGEIMLSPNLSIS
jgi:hypothetical protein